MAILVLDHDPGIAFVFGAIDGQDDDAAMVVDDVAFAGEAAGLDQLVVDHAEERTFEEGLGADDLLGLFDGRLEQLGSLLCLGLRGL